MITSWSAVISWSSVDQWIVDQMISEKLIRWSVNSWGSVIPWAFHHMFPGLFFYLPLVDLSFLSKSSWSPNILHFLLNLSTSNLIFFLRGFKRYRLAHDFPLAEVQICGLPKSKLEDNDDCLDNIWKRTLQKSWTNPNPTFIFILITFIEKRFKATH